MNLAIAVHWDARKMYPAPPGTVSQCIILHHGNKKVPDNAVMYLSLEELYRLGRSHWVHQWQLLVEPGVPAIMAGDSNQDGVSLLLLHQYW